MATYLVLAKFTQQGIQSVKDSPKRRAAAKEAAKSLGAEIKQVFLTMGPYDVVIVAEAPNDEVIATLTLKMGALGNLTTLTLPAFDEATTDRLIGSL